MIRHLSICAAHSPIDPIPGSDGVVVLTQRELDDATLASLSHLCKRGPIITVPVRVS